MARLETAASIINDAAVEVGLLPSDDTFGTQDQAFIQLRTLFNSAGRELVSMFAWQILQQPYTLTTQIGDSGMYDLPDDFDRMINQTGWNRSANLPVPGPLSPQTYAMVIGRDFGSTTLYVSFMLSENKLVLYPTPPPADIDISFSYISRNWLRDAGGTTIDRATANDDTALFDPLLLTKFLIVKYKAAKGYDIAVASREFDMCYMSITGYDKGARILSASGDSGYPYLTVNNIPFTGFGGA
jgi:hypothetical protein